MPEITLEGRYPVPTSLQWGGVTMTAPDGSSSEFLVLQIETPQGMNTYFLPKDIALQLAAGIGSIANQMRDQSPAGLIVPEVDMNEVIKFINPNGNPKGHG